MQHDPTPSKTLKAHQQTKHLILPMTCIQSMPGEINALSYKMKVFKTNAYVYIRKAIISQEDYFMTTYSARRPSPLNAPSSVLDAAAKKNAVKVLEMFTEENVNIVIHAHLNPFSLRYRFKGANEAARHVFSRAQAESLVDSATGLGEFFNDRGLEVRFRIKWKWLGWQKVSPYDILPRPTWSATISRRDLGPQKPQP